MSNLDNLLENWDKLNENEIVEIAKTIEDSSIQLQILKKLKDINAQLELAYAIKDEEVRLEAAEVMEQDYYSQEIKKTIQNPDLRMKMVKNSKRLERCI